MKICSKNKKNARWGVGVKTHFRSDQETAMESPAFKEFLKQYWNFRTHDEKIQYNPIDVKSLVEKQSYKYNTHWTDQNQHVKIHMGFFF